MTIREWRTCRIYDPAIDLSPKLDDDGNPVMRKSEDGAEDIVSRSDVAAFAEERDEKCLVLLDGKSPVWFWLAPLTVKQVRDHVGRATTVDERNLRAFECAALSIENLEPSKVTVARKEGDVVMCRDGELDRLMQMGLTMGDFWEIGAAAFTKATVPKGCGAALHVPRSSIVALGARRAAFLPAAVSDHESPKPAPRKGRRVPTTTQAD